MGCVIQIKNFPSIGCLIADGNLNTLARKDKYLGGAISDFIDGKMTVKLLLQTDVEMVMFAEWWVTDLNYGTNPFNITLPFFATTKEYMVYMTNPLVENGVKGELREISLELKQIS